MNTVEIVINSLKHNRPNWLGEVKERQNQTFCNDINMIYARARADLKIPKKRTQKG